MQQDWLTNREVHVATERRLKYQGTARVRLEEIEFNPPLPIGLERLKIDKLKQTWKEDGCRRLDAENYIPALASSEAISQALARIGMTPECFKNNRTNHLPSMTFDPNQIKGLHGRHRIYAAADFLAPADKWWVVDIYLDDVDDALRDHLVEEYDLNREHTDGYIYRKIRQFDDDHAIGTRWKAHLSSSNRQRWEQIINNNWLRKAFDELLDIPGLWIDGMRLSMVHRLVAISCPEEICAYLNHVHRFWSSLVDDDTDAKKCIDQKTIKKLELLAPGTSPDDAKSAQQVILTGQVFPDFDEDRRTEIWDRLKGFKGLIPSLRTFFEDFKYLESCAYCLKRLVGPSEVSIHQALKQIFIVASDTTNDYLIQIAEYEYREVHMVSAQQFDFGYCQLWLYAMRHYPLIPPDPKKQNHHLAKPKLAPADQHAIYNMAHLAHRLGFRSTEINTIINASPDHQIARTALLQARKPDRYCYDADTFETLIDRLVECFATARPACETATQPTLSKPVKAQARCGLPKLQAQEHDKSTLFLPSFIDEFPKTNHVTSWFVRRCVFGAFLGANLTPLEDGFQNILSGLLISPSPRTANPLFPQIETLRSGPSLDGLETSVADLMDVESVADSLTSSPQSFQSLDVNPEVGISQIPYNEHKFRTEDQNFYEFLTTQRGESPPESVEAGHSEIWYYENEFRTEEQNCYEFFTTRRGESTPESEQAGHFEILHYENEFRTEDRSYYEFFTTPRGESPVESVACWSVNEDSAADESLEFHLQNDCLESTR